MFDARAVLGIVLYFKEKILKPLRKDGYLNRCNLPKMEHSPLWWVFHFCYGKDLTNQRPTGSRSDVATAACGGCRERKEVQRSKLFGVPSRKKFRAPQECKQTKFAR
jgi:hypothetical protein